MDQKLFILLQLILIYNETLKLLKDKISHLRNKIKKQNIIIMGLLGHKGFPNIWNYGAKERLIMGIF